MKTYSMKKPDWMPITDVSLESIQGTGRWMNIMKQTQTRVSDGKMFPWEVLVKKNASVVLPVTKEGELILLDQFRYPLQDWELECPAETLDQVGDTPALSAARALQEEIGYRTERLIQMSTYASSGGTTTELAYTFLALDCIKIDDGCSRSEDELIQMNIIPRMDISDFLSARRGQGQIFNPKMDALLGRYLRNELG